MRIQLFCDHKWRDLPNVAAIKVALERKGHRVMVSSTKDAVALAMVFRPDAVVFNHLFSKAYRNIASALKANGRAVVVLPTEGAMRPEYSSIAAGEFSDFSGADLVLAWSESAANDIRQRWRAFAPNVAVAGCTRFDFHHQRFRSLVMGRDEFCRRNELDPNRPIATWATAYAYAHLHENTSKASWAQFKREGEEVGIAECLRRIGIKLTDLPRLFAEGRQACATSFFRAAKAMPDVQFVIKPHPVENRDFYRTYVQKHALKNVRFCPEDYVWNILNATDVHLHRHCTTAVEAWMWNKPTIEMGMDHHPAWEWPDREAGSDVALTTDDLVDLIRLGLDEPVDVDKKNYRQNYIQKWFGPVDGRRCEAAADLIDISLRNQAGSSIFRPIRGLPVPLRQQLRGVVGYFLDIAPGERLLHTRTRSYQRTGLGSEDKYTLRSDVIEHCRRAASVIDKP